ncbi:MAG: 3-oxoacyl-ACP reductase FabG [Gammaproteobacteria bacterium]|nr:3-oxoacyl-ACP reductase FabG [Gammaproteobacteria bacterium]
MNTVFTANALAGQTALVTGASRGIGRAIASALAAAGARVIGTATQASGAEAISTALSAVGGRGAVLDVADAASVDALLAQLDATGEMPGILVNNAGITRDNLLVRMKPEDWDAVIATDLTSVFRLSRGCLRHMMKQRFGRIISITSVVGAMGNAGQTNYAAAKAGVIGFTKSLAKEVGSRQITVNAIAPGFIDTDMTRALEPAQREALAAGIPLARLGESEDIAAATVFLASVAGGYITGQTLHVNGGLYLS